tara:strand:+ start:315 stop:455 length:141 start_codon:yes stop_codon:yes gene_type:complete
MTVKKGEERITSKAKYKRRNGKQCREKKQGNSNLNSKYTKQSGEMK